MQWIAIKRKVAGAAPSSVKPARPWAMYRQGPTGEAEWLRDARGRIRTFADERAARDAVARVAL